MMIDQTLLVRQTIIATLKADVTLTALVPAARIYPKKTPSLLVWPFIRVETDSDDAIRTDGGAGSQVTGAVHCFVKTSAATPDAEKTSAQIKSRIAQIIDSMDEIQSGDVQIDVYARGGQNLQDSAEADAFHGFVNFEASVI